MSIVKMLKISFVVLCTILVANASPRGKKKDLENKVINQSQEGELTRFYSYKKLLTASKYV